MDESINKNDPYNPKNDHLANLKVQIIKLSYIHGIKPIARSFYLQPKTIREWKSLFEHGGINALVTKKSRLDIHLLETCLNKYNN